MSYYIGVLQANYQQVNLSTAEYALYDFAKQAKSRLQTLVSPTQDSRNINPKMQL